MEGAIVAARHRVNRLEGKFTSAARIATSGGGTAPRASLRSFEAQANADEQAAVATVDCCEGRGKKHEARTAPSPGARPSPSRLNRAPPPRLQGR